MVANAAVELSIRPPCTAKLAYLFEVAKKTRTYHHGYRRDSLHHAILAFHVLVLVLTIFPHDLKIRFSEGDKAKDSEQQFRDPIEE